MKTLFINILVFLALVLAFDAISYWLLPADYGARFPAYRREPEKDSPPQVAGHGKYPKDYFVAHPRRGFDIGTDRRGSHWVEGVTYPIWSNSIGCFDKEHAEYDPYLYFAGDSFTWGYTPFEEKFGALIETMTGVRILKCGVSHTGQRHQYRKLIEIVDRIGYLPRALFVFYNWNDVINDYTFPHSTVIDGWLVDRVYVDANNQVIERTDRELALKVAYRLQRNVTEDLAGWGRRYFLSLNLLLQLKKQLSGYITVPQRLRGGIYPSLPQDLNEEAYRFSDNPMARKNKAALIEFRDFAERNDLPLVVVLIPLKFADPRRSWETTQRYREVRDFLADSGIRFVDLNISFHAQELAANRVFWRKDPHLNPTGNRAVAEILIDEFPRLFSIGKRP